MSRVALLISMSLALAACSGDRGGEAPQPEETAAAEKAAVAKAAEQAAEAAAEAEDGVDKEEPDNPMATNGLTEAEFKALHVLKQGQAPTPTGAMIEIGGQAHYLSLPDRKSGPMPAVIVIHEWWGLNDNIKHWADRLSAAGFAALAVDLYSGKTATTPDEAMAAMKAVDPAKASATLKAAAKWLAEDERITAPKTGVIGWCFGGAWSLQAGLQVEGLDAVVMYYGRTVTEPEKLAGLDAPLLGIFANQDDHIPAASVDAFEAALKTAGKTATIHRYDAKHAFANPSSQVYDEKNAADAWSKVEPFLKQHLSN